MNPTIRKPAEGRTLAVVGDVYRFLATGEDTDGKYALWEAIVPPGGGPPPPATAGRRASTSSKARSPSLRRQRSGVRREAVGASADPHTERNPPTRRRAKV